MYVCIKYSAILNIALTLTLSVFSDGLASFGEDEIHAGCPHPSNADYAMSKRMLHLHVDKVVRTTGRNWKTLIPTNMYGPCDSFCPVNGHVVGSLIGKSLAAAPGPLKVFGTGCAKRQLMYVDDMAAIILQCLDAPLAVPAMICAPTEEVTIAEVSALIAGHGGRDLAYDDSYSDGQLRKFAISAHFETLFPDFQYTSVAEGIQKTVDWYKANCLDTQQ